MYKNQNSKSKGKLKIGMTTIFTSHSHRYLSI